MIQTIDEVRRIAADWGYNLAPADMVQNEKNAQLLVDYCLAQFGVITAGGLTHAYNALRAKLDLVPQPKKSQVEIAAKLEAKMRRDFAESIKPQSVKGRQNFNDQKAAKEKTEALGKEFKSINSQIEYEISGYTAGHPSGVTDYSRTESGRATLRGVRDGYDRRFIEGARAALSAVRAAKNEL
jgi:hypothetical protein